MKEGGWEPGEGGGAGKEGGKARQSSLECAASYLLGILTQTGL